MLNSKVSSLLEWPFSSEGERAKLKGIFVPTVMAVMEKPKTEIDGPRSGYCSNAFLMQDWLWTMRMIFGFRNET